MLFCCRSIGSHLIISVNLINVFLFFSYLVVSAMLGCVESGMLRGRPFGEVITLVNNKLRKYILNP